MEIYNIYNINSNEQQREIKIEDMTEITLSIEKMPNDQNNQPNWKWFLTNKDELINSKINPIGLGDNLTVESIENRFNFKFKILIEARTCIAKFSYKENHDSQENENTPKKEINIIISQSIIYDTDMLFSKTDDAVGLDVNEISDIDSKEIIIEKNKTKNIMIKGQQHNEYAWFIENYNSIKDIIFISKLEDNETGKLSYAVNNQNQGFYEFNLKVSLFPNELPNIKLIYKKINPNPNQEQKKDKNIINIEIKLVKKAEYSQESKNVLNDCNKYTIPIYVCQALITIGSALILFFSRKVHEDSLIIDVVSKDLIEDLEFGYITNISSKASNSEIDSKESNSDDFVFDKWQGTNDGCGKKEGDKPTVKILEKGKECEKDEEYLERIPPIEINNYKGFILNMQTPSYISYYDLLNDGSIIKKNEKCPENKKSCGYIDTKQNILCLDKNKECPINYIKIDKTPPEGISNIKTIAGKKEINIYFSNNPYENGEGTPFIQVAFKIGEDELCTIPSLYYSNINLFKLDAFIKDYANKCSLKDYTQDYTKILGNYYYSLDTIDNYELYEDNKIIERIKNSKLVTYGYDVEKYRNNKLHLYVRTHYGYDKDCLENRNKKYDIKQQLKKMNGIGDKMRTWSEEMFLTIPCMLFSLADIFVISNKCSQKDCSTTESLIKNISNLIVNLTSLILSIIANSFDDPGEDLMTCSDEYVNDNYNVMTLKIRKSGHLILWISIANGIVLILNLFICIYKAILDLCLHKKDSNIIKKYKFKIKELNEKLVKAQIKQLEKN